MTEYEMASLSQEMVNNRTAQISLLISIMSAFMVVGYTTAHRLTIILNSLIVTLYSLLIIPRILTIITSSETLMGLIKAMAERFAKGTEFQWARSLEPISETFLAKYYGAFNGIVWWSLFLATIAFYFLARQLNVKREQEEATKLASATNAAVTKPPSSETQSMQP